MDLPFVIFIPYGRGGEEIARRVPPASLQLDKRSAETFYEIVVTVQQGPQEQRKYPFPVPMSRYDTLSTFGMYNRPESAERVTDHLVTLGISLPRWSYGPLDPVSVYIKLSPNPDWMSKAKKVTIQSITVGIDEEIIYNHEGDEPSRKTKTLARHQQSVGVKMPEAGYFTNLGLVFPARELRDSEGILPRGKKEFPHVCRVRLHYDGHIVQDRVFPYGEGELQLPTANLLITNFYTTGEAVFSTRYTPPTAHCSLPIRPRRMQRGNGSYRTSGKGRLSHYSGKSYAPCCDDYQSQRPSWPESLGYDDCSGTEETAYRMRRWVS